LRAAATSWFSLEERGENLADELVLTPYGAGMLPRVAEGIAVEIQLD
jgi:hypothetical protein